MYSKKQSLDKFYTKDSVAINCIKNLDLSDYDYVIEPSAGGGSFSRNIEHNNLIAMDLEPESENIIKQDWFEYKHTGNGRTLVIGNPPFGLRNQLSKKFIQHALEFADTIAMVLPEVFEKHTMQKIFTKGWRLKEIYEIGDNAFTINNKEYHVPCKFFIFDKSEGKNLMFDISLYKECDDFVFCKKEEADLFIMGAGCKVKRPEDVLPSNRGYYLKSNIETSQLITNLNSVNWNGKSSANGGVWWITKPELIKIYKEKYEKAN